MFDLNGLLEIRRETAIKDWGQDFITSTGLKDAFYEPTVKASIGTLPCLKGEDAKAEGLCKVKIFYINRIVVLYDQNVYEI